MLCHVHDPGAGAAGARADWLIVEHGIISDSKSGVSGAGKEPTQNTHFVEVADNLSAYSVFGHRHAGEILEQLGLVPEQLIFTPHLLPIPRGILSTIYVRLNAATSAQAIEDCLRKFYAGTPWVRVFPAASCRRSSIRCTPTIATLASRWRRTASGW